MANKERKLYQKNKLSYLLLLVFILLNVVYTIFTLNNMEVNLQIGLFILITITLLLLGFLTAIKVQNYSKTWSYVALVMGVFQFSRLFFTKNIAEPKLAAFLVIILIVSAAASIAGGVTSLQSSRTRKKLVIEYNRKNNYGIK